MRYVTGFIFAALTVSLCWFLDGKRTDAVSLGLGRFLDPFGGIWQNAEAEDAYQDDEIGLEGPKGAIQIVYDTRRVPHVFAETEEDLYFGQGYATARDRLWQMEFQVMAAGGRLAEVIDNPRVIPVDRTERRKGMVVAAQRSLEAVEKDPVCSKVVDAYTAGVNAYINELSPADYPFEYKMLEYAPENWTALKTMLLLKRMAWNLSGRTYDFNHGHTVDALGWEGFAELLPMVPDSTDPIIPKTTTWDFEPLPIPEKPADSIPTETYDVLKYPQPAEGLGSNNWAVHGSRTKNGHAILCNDPHLGMTLPAIWYEIQLHGPGINTYGVSLPGAPGVVIGFNEDIAWGMTNSARDVLDWYHIEFKDEKREEYRYGDGWRKVEKVIEEIKVRNGETIYDTVLWTHHGPVLYDRNFGDPNGERPLNIAMRWAAHDPSLEYLAFHHLNRAKNHADYRAAIKNFTCPGQNFIFASKTGDIAITQQGRFVNKWEGQGLFVMDGANPAHEWQGYIPAEHNPHVKNPPRGFVSSANQQATDTTYPYRIDGYYSLTRGRRVNQMLSGMRDVTVEDMMQMQMDNFNQMAAETRGGLLAQIDEDDLTPEGFEVFAALDDWNLMNDAKEVAPIYWNIWSYRLRDEFWLAKFGETEMAPHAPNRYLTLQVIAAMSTDTNLTVRRENQALLAATLNAVAEEAAEWKKENPDLEFVWYNYNNPTIQHLARLEAFSHDHVETGGGRGIVNANQGRAGPSWRMIIEMGPEIKAYGTYPGGPSGNPGSIWYDNQIPSWSSGKFSELIFYKGLDEAKEKATSMLQLNPED